MPPLGEGLSSSFLRFLKTLETPLQLPLLTRFWIQAEIGCASVLCIVVKMKGRAACCIWPPVIVLHPQAATRQKAVFDGIAHHLLEVRVGEIKGFGSHCVLVREVD